MSRSVHAQANQKLRELPRCSKCKRQFVLVMATYPNPESDKSKNEIYLEWECACGRVVDYNLLKEGKLESQDQELHEWVEKRNEKEGSNRQGNRRRRRLLRKANRKRRR